MKLPRVVRNNLPAAKPEFWREPIEALKRRLALAVHSALDGGFSARPFIATLAGGTGVLEVRPNETIGRAVAESGVYEFAPSEIVRAYLRRGDIFADVGANLGYYTVLAAERVGASGRVVAFEPYAPVRARLLRNVALNEFSHVEVVPLCVGARAGTAYLAPPACEQNAGTAEMRTEQSPGSTPASVVPLDEALHGRTPALVKVDVEGHEAEVFAGASALLSSEDAPSIVFESFRVAEDAALLQRHGYEVFSPVLDRGRVALLPLSANQPYYRDWEAPNYFAAKSARGLAFVRDFMVAR
jgi:FkbM family methyltransferase